MATTGSERGLTLRSPGRFLAATTRLIDLYRSTGCTDPRLRDRIVACWMRAEAYQLFTLAAVTQLSEARGAMGAESSINKIWWSELDVDLHECALDLLGPEAQLEGAWSKGYQFSLSGPIYAGTNEIQRNIAAERVLGLPRK
jgi:alkylation response protein AidB-like acyl-CoA dehydrogenase